ncbi:RteC domain-containing protein [Flavobacterium cucumis]|uniref:RteC protein n=1 Tax=Flavobacterium cucumis TaxID=416016 RepID=A0A1M7ZZG5_9FLAO|nr:RteC domain-containing protein [Flavobacterium cucumis]SHO74017.1 RteC protein [Flavobacterium cucumis]
MIATIKNNSLLDFEYELSLILNANGNEIEKAKKCIIFTQDVVIQLNEWLKHHEFESLQDEITFFKEIKPHIMAQYIFYTEILELLTTLPLDKSKKVKHYEKKKDAIHQFYRKHREFIKYIKSQATHLDALYFTRKRHSAIFVDDYKTINQDATVCTSHDYLLAEVIAYELLALHIENYIDHENQSCAVTQNQIQSSLHWTAKKIDLIELIYALYESKVFDNGQAELKEITHVFEKAFQIDLGDNITRSYIDIKNRKSDAVRFLNQLQTALVSKIGSDIN